MENVWFASFMQKAKSLDNAMIYLFCPREEKEENLTWATQQRVYKYLNRMT